LIFLGNKWVFQSTLNSRAGWTIYQNNEFRARIKYFFSEDGRIEGYYFAKLSGRMTMEMDHKGNHPLFELIEDIVEPEFPLVIDMHRIREIDTAGIGSLIMLLRQRRNVPAGVFRGKTIITGIPECARQLFEVYKIPQSSIEIYSTLDEALIML